MKTYVKPTLVYIELASEERFAVTSVCEEYGACPDGFRYAG